MTAFSLRPNTDAMATASTMYGMERNTSITRLMTVSVLPLKKPATAPRSSPMTTEMAVAAKPMRSDTRAP
jgi:hypothetical protein